MRDANVTGLKPHRNKFSRPVRFPQNLISRNHRAIEIERNSPSNHNKVFCFIISQLHAVSKIIGRRKRPVSECFLRTVVNNGDAWGRNTSRPRHFLRLHCAFAFPPVMALRRGGETSFCALRNRRNAIVQATRPVIAFHVDMAVGATVRFRESVRRLCLVVGVTVHPLWSPTSARTTQNRIGVTKKIATPANANRICKSDCHGQFRVDG